MADNDGINEEGLERLREALKIEKERSQLEEERLKWTKSRTDKLKEQRDLQGEILSKIKNIDGFLIGGASQKPNKFIDIIKKSYI